MGNVRVKLRHTAHPPSWIVARELGRSNHAGRTSSRHSSARSGRKRPRPSGTHRGFRAFCIPPYPIPSSPHADYFPPRMAERSQHSAHLPPHTAGHAKRTAGIQADAADLAHCAARFPLCAAGPSPVAAQSAQDAAESPLNKAGHELNSADFALDTAHTPLAPAQLPLNAERHVAGRQGSFHEGRSRENAVKRREKGESGHREAAFVTLLFRRPSRLGFLRRLRQLLVPVRLVHLTPDLPQLEPLSRGERPDVASSLFHF